MNNFSPHPGWLNPKKEKKEERNVNETLNSSTIIPEPSFIQRFYDWIELITRYSAREYGKPFVSTDIGRFRSDKGCVLHVFSHGGHAKIQY